MEDLENITYYQDEKAPDFNLTSAKEVDRIDLSTLVTGSLILFSGYHAAANYTVKIEEAQKKIRIWYIGSDTIGPFGVPLCFSGHGNGCIETPLDYISSTHFKKGGQVEETVISKGAQYVMHTFNWDNNKKLYLSKNRERMDTYKKILVINS